MIGSKSYGQKIVILEQFLKMATKWQSFDHNFWSDHPIDLIFHHISYNFMGHNLAKFEHIWSNLFFWPNIVKWQYLIEKSHHLGQFFKLFLLDIFW